MKDPSSAILLALLLFCPFLGADIIDSTDESEIYDKAEELLQEVDDNGVAAAFANEGGELLTKVATYAHYGEFIGIPDFDVQVGQTSVNLLANTLNLIGSAGLMCYDIESTTYKVCVAFYSPFNDVFYDNQFNMKIYEQSQTNNEDIFKHMLSDSAAWFEANAGEYVYRSEYGIEMRAIMDRDNKATLALFVDSRGHNPFLGPDLNYGCDLDFLDRKCWRECDANNPGWQWTTQDCWNIDDCGDPNELIPETECEIDGPW